MTRSAGGGTRWDRPAALGAAAAAAWLLLLVAIDVSLPHTIIPDTLFGLAPLIACAVLPWRPTAAVGAVAVLLVVWSGFWNDAWGTAQQWVRLLDVCLNSAVAIVIAHVRVRRERRLARVTAVAEAAQGAILPILPATADGVAIAGRYLSAAEDAVVGGDLYDCSLEGHTRVIVGDVRGKGIAGVEHAARVIRAFRQAAPMNEELTGVARSMHRYLRPFLGDEDFVTALLVDVSSPGVVQLVSCGHPPALLVRADGSAALLEAPAGVPLGIGSDAEEHTVPWGAGDRLLLYTDGLSEARDAAGRFLPLEDVAPLLRSGSPAEALDSVLDLVRVHVPGGRLGDDLAVVILENDPSATKQLVIDEEPPLPVDSRRG